MTRKIGLYGGSFDPPHLGHIFTMVWAKLNHVDDIIMLPSWKHAFGKSRHANWEQRLQMCKLATSDFPFIEVSDIEKQIASGYTYDALVSLKELHPGAEFRLMVGGDIANELDSWHRGVELQQMAAPLKIGRDSYDTGDDLELALPNISSSAIRAALKKGHHTGHVPRAIRDYIHEAELYQ